MGFRVRVWLLGTVACAATIACAAMALAAPAAQAAGFGVERFVAANCIEGHESCVEELFEEAYPLPKEPTLEEAKAAGYTQAAGHPPYGITAFKVNTEGAFPNAIPAGLLTEGPVTHVRTDVGPGVSTNPTAVPLCSMKQFDSSSEEKEAIPGTGFYPAPSCSTDAKIGVNKVVVAVLVEPVHTIFEDLPLMGKVYNLVQPFGLSSDFGVALELPKTLTGPALKKAFEEKKHPFGEPTEKELEEGQYFAHTLIEGHVEWASDYHDYYEISVSPELPLISSILTLKGNILLPGEEKGGFITNPSNCAPPGPATTNTVTLVSKAGQTAVRKYTTPIGTEGCKGEPLFKVVPFAPTFAVEPETTQSDKPTGVTTELTVPHDQSPAGIDSSQLKDATITLPEGMTLNPPAATGLKTCSLAQIGIGTRNPVTCPVDSRLGTVTLAVPDLPENEPLTGYVYLGGTEPLTHSPYTIYVEAESARYGVLARVQGTVKTNESTGQVTAEFLDNPEQPFSKIALTFKGGALAPMANPLKCGTATTSASFVPYTTDSATVSLMPTFPVDSNGSGGACASPLPFSLSQSTASQPSTGGASTSFTFNLARADGQQYLSHVTTALPVGLVGKIASVPQCPEPQATTGECSSESQIGTATTTVGSGSAPAQFSGPVYLTGPTGGAPYGMTTVVSTAIGPFNLGNVVVRSKIEVNPYTAQVTVSSEVPTIYKGVPLRLKTLSLAINRQGFLINPTNCAAMSTSSTLTSSLGATQAVSTPFQAGGCSGLTFAPKFGASSNAKTSRANGAALVTNINVPSTSQANFKSVLVTLPKQLPSRLSTLKNACTAAVFNANPGSCPANSVIGTARVKTPVLPGQLIGPAYYVSHGGAAFPDVDLVLKGDGVTVILVGNTNIKNGITTTNFASNPDVPFAGFELNLPSGPNSAVTAIGNICKQSLVMPTTITAQNGKVFKQNTAIAVSGCPVTVVSSKAKGKKAAVTVRVPEAGRVSGGGSNLKTVYNYPGKAKNVIVEVPLTASTRPIVVRVRIGFVPKAKGKKSSTVYATVRFA
jgi:hypothetical protein